MSEEKIEKFILENLFNKDHVLYDSKGINGTRDWLADHIAQVNGAGLLMLQRALHSVREAKRIATETREDLRGILKNRKRLIASGYMEKKASAYLSWIDHILD